MFTNVRCLSLSLQTVFLLGTRRLKMTAPEQDSPDLREEGSSCTVSDSFHFLVQKAVADFTT